MPDREEFYQTVLDGLARHLESPFIADILAAIRRFPEAELHFALNKNQIAGKKWLLDELYRAVGGRLGTVHVLGGWYGVLAAMLLHDRRFDIDRAVSFDIDPACAPVANVVNRVHVDSGRFKAVTADIHDVAADPAARPDTLVNTSCEHIASFDGWYGRVPHGVLQVLQSNDYFDCDEHSNCVASLEAFKRQAPMSQVLFAGSLPARRYTRFMVIGRK